MLEGDVLLKKMNVYVCVYIYIYTQFGQINDHESRCCFCLTSVFFLH